jgi:hypothetical protein
LRRAASPYGHRCPQTAAGGTVPLSMRATLFVFVGGTVVRLVASLSTSSGSDRFSRSGVVLPLVASALAASAAAQQPAAFAPGRPTSRPTSDGAPISLPGQRASAC